MSGSKTGLGTVFLAVVLALAIGVPAYAQGSFFSQLSGTVVDADGAAMPGVTITVKNLGTSGHLRLSTPPGA